MGKNEEARKKAAEIVDQLKERWRAAGLPCPGWDEGPIREALIETMTDTIKECQKLAK
jgi:hypothetical protein